MADKENLKEEFNEIKTAAKTIGTAAKKIADVKGKEAVAKTKTTTKKVVDIFKKTKVHTFVQVAGKEISEDEVVELVKEAYRSESPDKEVKELNLYIKPEEDAVYYVVNGVSAGKIDI